MLWGCQVGLIGEENDPPGGLHQVWGCGLYGKLLRKIWVEMGGHLDIVCFSSGQNMGNSRCPSGPVAAWWNQRNWNPAITTHFRQNFQCMPSLLINSYGTGHNVLSWFTRWRWDWKKGKRYHQASSRAQKKEVVVLPFPISTRKSSIGFVTCVAILTDTET